MAPMTTKTTSRAPDAAVLRLEQTATAPPEDGWQALSSRFRLRGVCLVAAGIHRNHEERASIGISPISRTPALKCVGGPDFDT